MAEAKHAEEALVIPDVNAVLPFDLSTDEDEVFQRYESVYKAFLLYKTLNPLKKRLDDSDVGKNIQGTIVDYAVAHALQGAEYINEIQMNLQYTVLQSALILTISMPLYIDPPSYSKNNIDRAFSAMVGLAAFCQISVIVGCTIIAGLLNRPYTDADTMVARVKANPLLVTVNVINYVAMIATTISMLIAGFDRALIDGAVQTYVGYLFLVLAGMAVATYREGGDYQDRRALAFYKKYCEDNGRLRPEFLARAYVKKTN